MTYFQTLLSVVLTFQLIESARWGTINSDSINKGWRCVGNCKFNVKTADCPPGSAPCAVVRGNKGANSFMTKEFTIPAGYSYLRLDLKYRPTNVGESDQCQIKYKLESDSKFTLYKNYRNTILNAKDIKAFFPSRPGVEGRKIKVRLEADAHRRSNGNIKCYFGNPVLRGYLRKNGQAFQVEEDDDNNNGDNDWFGQNKEIGVVLIVVPAVCIMVGLCGLMVLYYKKRRNYQKNKEIVMNEEQETDEEQDGTEEQEAIEMEVTVPIQTTQGTVV